MITILSRHKLSQMPPVNIDPRSLEGLPNDMLFETLKELDFPNIISVCQSSKNLNERVCENEVFWQTYIRHWFPEKAHEKYDHQTWKEFAKYLNTEYIKPREKSERYLREIARNPEGVSNRELELVRNAERVMKDAGESIEDYMNDMQGLFMTVHVIDEAKEDFWDRRWRSMTYEQKVTWVLSEDPHYFWERANPY